MTPCEQDPDRWFSEEIIDVKYAKRQCNSCALKDVCLQAGLREEYGVWGGLSIYERARLRRQMRRAAA